jgi:hypothetical protein
MPVKSTNHILVIKLKMSNWFLKVPKVAHFYWGSGKLPYLRFKTVETFMKLNPKWKVILWMPKFPAKVITWNTGQLDYVSTWTDYLPNLLNLPIEKRYFDFTDIGISNDISEVHKSDFLRYYILSTIGGVWSDMDILYFKPITNLSVNIKEFKDKETFVCISSYGHSNGFFMARKGSKFFQRMFDLSKDISLVKYQSNGPDLCNKYFPTIKLIDEFSPAVNIDMESVYYYNFHKIPDVYSKGDPLFPPRSIGMHWYAGHPLAGKFLRDTNGGLENLPDNLIGNLLKILQ